VLVEILNGHVLSVSMNLVVSLAKLDVVCVGANLVVSVAFGLVFAEVLPWRDILADELAWMSGSDVECARGVEPGVVRLTSGSVFFGRLGQLTVSCGVRGELALNLSAYGEVLWLSYQSR
jgi:hypothetical protein